MISSIIKNIKKHISSSTSVINFCNIVPVTVINTAQLQQRKLLIYPVAKE